MQQEDELPPMIVQKIKDLRDCLTSANMARQELMVNNGVLVGKNRQVRHEHTQLTLENIRLKYRQLFPACQALLLLRYGSETNATDIACTFLQKQGYVDAEGMITEEGKKLMEEKFE